MSTVYDSRIEKLIEAAVADGVLTDQERRVLINNANNYGYDLDEFEMYVNAKLFEAQQRLKATTQKNNKVGEVKKCPNCGATIDTAAVKCPECGYIFGGVEANSSAQRLAKLLHDTNEESKKSDIVVNYPVPSTKADLMEFMADLMFRAKHYNDADNEELASAFKAKFRECAAKAHLYFENDPDFQPLFNLENDSKKFRFSNLSKSTRTLVVLVALLVVLYLFLMLMPLIH